MQIWNSFLQTVFRFVKSLIVHVSKKMHRNAAVLATGAAVVAVVTFTAGDFHGGGRNALVAFAETQQVTDGTETDLEETQAAAQTMDEAPESSPTESFKQESAEAAIPGNETEEETAETAVNETKAAETGGEETPETETPPETKPETEPATVAETEPETAAKTKTAEAEEVSYSGEDYQVLLRIVQAEAGICDTKGRILVANVILNRVESDEFPDTVTGVVYEKYQFSPVSDGTFDTCKVTKKTVDAVDRALAGEDYSEGALYFMNRKTSSKKNVRWFDSHLDYLFAHGNHEFFK